MTDEISLYERVGGTAVLRAPRRRRSTRASPPTTVLAPLYPESSRTSAGARHRLTLFLVQYWGGPTTYSDERGHPRLRMRHLPFTIGEAERDRWLVHMLHAVDVATGALDVDADERDDVAGRAARLLPSPAPSTCATTPACRSRHRASARPSPEARREPSIAVRNLVKDYGPRARSTACRSRRARRGVRPARRERRRQVDHGRDPRRSPPRTAGDVTRARRGPRRGRAGRSATASASCCRRRASSPC